MPESAPSREQAIVGGARAYALVLDDHPLTGRGTVALLSSHPMLAGAEYAPDVAAATALMQRRGPPALVLADFWLGADTSCAWVRALQRSSPGTRVIAVSGDDRSSVRALVAASGADGFVAKSEPPGQLVRAVTAVLSGSGWPAETAETPGAGAATPESAPTALTRRQGDVLDLVLKGWPNKRIASELSLSEATVKEHVSAILARLGMATRAQLIAQIGRSARSLPGAA